MARAIGGETSSILTLNEFRLLDWEGGGKRMCDQIGASQSPAKINRFISFVTVDHSRSHTPDFLQSSANYPINFSNSQNAGSKGSCNFNCGMFEILREIASPVISSWSIESDMYVLRIISC